MRYAIQIVRTFFDGACHFLGGVGGELDVQGVALDERVGRVQGQVQQTTVLGGRIGGQSSGNFVFGQGLSGTRNRRSGVTAIEKERGNKSLLITQIVYRFTRALLLSLLFRFRQSYYTKPTQETIRCKHNYYFITTCRCGAKITRHLCYQCARDAKESAMRS